MLKISVIIVLLFIAGCSAPLTKHEQKLAEDFETPVIWMWTY